MTPASVYAILIVFLTLAAVGAAYWLGLDHGWEQARKHGICPHCPYSGQRDREISDS